MYMIYTSSKYKQLYKHYDACLNNLSQINLSPHWVSPHESLWKKGRWSNSEKPNLWLPP